MDNAFNWSLLLSGFAVATSVVSTAIALVQKRYETARVLRQQITETVARLIELAAEHADLVSDPTVDKNSATFQNRTNMLQQKHVFYGQHAVFLMGAAKRFVSHADYLAVAGAFQQVGDFHEANHYYKIATATARNVYSRLITLRFHGYALYVQGDPAAGAAQYQAALAAFEGDSDYVLSTNGYTCQLWGAAEASSGDKAAASQLFAKADTLYQQIRSDAMKSNLRNGLRNELARQLSLAGIPLPDAAQGAPQNAGEPPVVRKSFTEWISGYFRRQ